MGSPQYRKTSHTLYDIKYHVVFTTKYRYRILSGKLARKARDLIRGICGELDVKIMKGHLSPDHIHMLVSVPPHLSVSKLMQYIKGKSSRKLQMEFGELKKTYWGKHIWARGYFCVSTGVVNEQMIKDYIEHHHEDENEEFTIEKT